MVRPPWHQHRLKDMETNKIGHGGKRQNAGRPKKDTRQLNIRISNTAFEIVDQEARKLGTTKANIIERLILNYID